MTIVFHTHTTIICACTPLNLSLSLSLIRVSVISYTLQSHLRAILFSLRACVGAYTWVDTSNVGTRAGIIRKTSPIMIMLLYDPDVPLGTFDLGAEVRTWSVRRVLLPSRDILISFMLDRAPRRYRSITGDLIFLPREISLNAPLPYFLSLAYVDTETASEPHAAGIIIVPFLRTWNPRSFFSFLASNSLFLFFFFFFLFKDYDIS